jgi:RNA polymerase sigma-B factor
MAMPPSPGPGPVSELHAAAPPPPARDLPQNGGAVRATRSHDRGGRDHTEQRAAALLMLTRMHRLDPGDPEHRRLRDQVIAEYMPYARHLAMRYAAGGRLARDLCQVAYLGLIKSVDRFDPNHGAAFLTYATPTILGELKCYFRDSSWAVHVPRRIQELSNDVRPVTETLVQRLHRNPTVPELAALLGADPPEILAALMAADLSHVHSLDLPAGTDQEAGAAYGDLLGAEDPGIQNVVDRETLRPLLARLPPRDKHILYLSFFRGMTQEQIGAELGVTQMQVSRLLSAILQRLRLGADCEPAP